MAMTIPAIPPAPPRPFPGNLAGRRHVRPVDHLAWRVLGEPLPCLCPACAERIDGWERERAGVASSVDTLSSVFWNRQAAALSDAGRGPAPRWRWAFAPAACLLLAAALFILPARSGRAPDDFEARWAEVQEALERPALGDLEACTVLIGGGEIPSLEESL